MAASLQADSIDLSWILKTRWCSSMQVYSFFYHAWASMEREFYLISEFFFLKASLMISRGDSSTPMFLWPCMSSKMRSFLHLFWLSAITVVQSVRKVWLHKEGWGADVGSISCKTGSFSPDSKICQPRVFSSGLGPFIFLLGWVDYIVFGLTTLYFHGLLNPIFIFGKKKKKRKAKSSYPSICLWHGARCSVLAGLK